MHDEAGVEAGIRHPSPRCVRIELVVRQRERTLREAGERAHKLSLALHGELRSDVMRATSEIFETRERALGDSRSTANVDS